MKYDDIEVTHGYNPLIETDEEYENMMDAFQKSYEEAERHVKYVNMVLAFVMGVGITLVVHATVNYFIN